MTVSLAWILIAWAVIYIVGAACTAYALRRNYRTATDHARAPYVLGLRSIRRDVTLGALMWPAVWVAILWEKAKP